MRLFLRINTLILLTFFGNALLCQDQNSIDHVDRLIELIEDSYNNNPDTIPFLSTEAIKIAEFNNDTCHIVKSYWLLGRYYQTVKDFDSYFENEMRVNYKYCKEPVCQECAQIKSRLAKELIKLHQYEDALQIRKEELLFRVYYDDKKRTVDAQMNIALSYAELKQKDSAEKYVQLVLNSSHQIEPGRRAYHCNNAGIVYRKLELLDSSKRYFQEAINIIEKLGENHSSYRSKFFIIGNLGSIYAKEGHYKKAINLLIKDYKGSAERKMRSSAFSSSILISQLYLKIGRADSATFYLNDFSNRFPDYSQLNSPTHLKALIALESGKGNNLVVLDLLEKLTLTTDSITKMSTASIGRIRLSREELLLEQEQSIFQLEKERSQSKIKSLETEKSLIRFRYVVAIFSIIVGIFIVTSFSIRANNRRVRKHEKVEMERQLLESEMQLKQIQGQKLKDEISIKNNQLTKMALDLSNRSEFAERFNKRLKKMRKKADDDLINDINELIVFTHNQTAADRSRSKLEQEIEKISETFYNLLNTKHPNLTKSEEQLCGLLRLNLSNKEISVIKGVSVSSIGVYKVRLKKKLNLNKNQDIHIYLNKLENE